MDFDELEIKEPKPSAISQPKTFVMNSNIYLLVNPRYSSVPKCRRRPQAKSALRDVMRYKNNSYEIYRVDPNGANLIFDTESELWKLYQDDKITADDVMNGIDW